jgi:DNA-binding beta-propeller fold protein YncE
MRIQIEDRCWRAFALRLLLCTALLGVLLLAVTASVRAAGRIYWSNLNSNSISYANLDGSGAVNLPIDPATLDGPMGLAIDSAAGKIYWANFGFVLRDSGTTIGVANLDGSDAHILPLPAGMVHAPHGLAINAGKLYWTNRDPGSGQSWIGVANLDGSGAAFFNAGAATVNGPRGLAIDQNKLYWANWNGNSISFANLGGGGGGNLNAGGATVQGPEGVAFDRAGRLFFSNFDETAHPNRISYLRLDGSGGADLDTSPLTPDDPHGVAIDPPAGRIYWAEYDGGRISYANLSGGGGTVLNTAGVTPNGPELPVLLEPPAGAGGPQINGSGAPRAKLRCTQGSWGPDMLDTLLYRAPRSYSYSWIRQGKTVPGANTNTLKSKGVAEYRCRVAASNLVGSAAQIGELQATFKVGKETLDAGSGTARLLVAVPGPGKLSLRGKGIAKTRLRRFERAGETVARKVKHRGKVRLLVAASGKAEKRLRRSGHATLKAKVVYAPRGGVASVQARHLKLVER